ncbi:uncharacterized protein EDB93DRAFT_294310 [Suillus bovinus]|uniref:uncharacterized protein n=1 Tax=Suillus bovinus TaxID=48563 RepID=UPI001B8722F9|nr:uncharacterized protein EDB93DRAFT_294310 [Suillus bovinus]KAG2159559.1 hypothetical protein EDB93DRAFT_294310 [Suillus bovinus]
MRLSFILAVAAAFKLTVSMPLVSDESDCPFYCGSSETVCCSNALCEPMRNEEGVVSMSSFHLTSRLTGVAASLVCVYEYRLTHRVTQTTLENYLIIYHVHYVQLDARPHHYS